MTKQTAKRPYTLRKFIGDIHLWLGIASGLVLFVVCLSGTIFTFRDEIVEWCNQEVFRVSKGDQQQAEPLPIQQLIDKISGETKSKVLNITIPHDRAKAWTFATVPSRKETPRTDRRARANEQHKEGLKGGRPGGGHGGPGGGKTYLVNPYTGIIQGTPENESSKFFMTMMQLHRWLLIEGEVGKMMVGMATLIFVILTLSGLVLWAPAKWKQFKNWKMWKPGFMIKTTNWKRFNHDLHNTLGFYSCLFLLVMALTGLCWSFEWYRAGLSELMGAKVFGGRNEKFPPSEVPVQIVQRLEAADYLELADRQLPYFGDVRLALPADDSASAVVTKNQIGFFASAATDKVVIDQYSGKYIKIDRFRDKPINEQIVASIRPLHLGNVYGTFSKILYFITCLIASSLPVTGVIIWINKLKKKSRRGAKTDKEKSGASISSEILWKPQG